MTPELGGHEAKLVGRAVAIGGGAGSLGKDRRSKDLRYTTIAE
ncbi:MAG TPA: hypothetical protein VN862_01670 [Candidatus Acidoferrales bacterium]|nr:hypothetical protein [Candidatus Acidoferrales bacterium]